MFIEMNYIKKDYKKDINFRQVSFQHGSLILSYNFKIGNRIFFFQSEVIMLCCLFLFSVCSSGVAFETIKCICLSAFKYNWSVACERFSRLKFLA